MKMNSYEEGLIVFDSRSKAYRALDSLYEECEKFGRASLWTYYINADLIPEEEYRYLGWNHKELNNIRLVVCMDGYYPKLPPTHLITPIGDW